MPYLVTTPKNPGFSGKVYGVQFSDGRAIVSQETLNPLLGWNVDQIIHSFRTDFGYRVEAITFKTEPVPVAAEPAPEPEPPAETEQPAQGAGVKPRKK